MDYYQLETQFIQRINKVQSATDNLFFNILLNIWRFHNLSPTDILYLNNKSFCFRDNPHHLYSLSFRSLGALLAKMNNNNDEYGYMDGYDMIGASPYLNSQLPVHIRIVLTQYNLLESVNID